MNCLVNRSYDSYTDQIIGKIRVRLVRKLKVRPFVMKSAQIRHDSALHIPLLDLDPVQPSLGFGGHHQRLIHLFGTKTEHVKRYSCRYRLKRLCKLSDIRHAHFQDRAANFTYCFDHNLLYTVHGRFLSVFVFLCGA